ncbi:hypothetical protein BpHYR1_044920 [Brachionus plicatilis]|uniref:Uncharacterized protein n=1 Tax=Brachionus plicatilis TaxID=10195 RepID=A0A3M7R5X0_BRAPC|nr:hypothetical protein BpHYR1_044920 [Brachionus plicatilis]
MGFVGLEKIVDSLKKSSKFNNIFVNVPLAELKFVVDGNQLMFIFLSGYQYGIYGGNYDKLFDNFVIFLNKMQPYIQIVIFNGSKESEIKGKERLKNKVSRMADFYADKNYSHFANEFNPLFSRNVLIEALIHVGIDYVMTSEMKVHGVACYANGNNPVKGFFTVLSKDSYFNVYYIEKGYVSWKYVADIFKNLSNIKSDLEVPVFYLRNLLASSRISFKSWIYFCILLGDHDFELGKNAKFYQKYKLDMWKFYKVLDHFRQNEINFHQNGYRDIRSTYDSTSIYKVDQIIDKIEFRVTNITFLTSLNQNLNDFDRFANNIRQFMKVFFPCLIENFNHEPSVFSNCLDTYYLSYALTRDKFKERSFVVEYFRKKNPTKQSQIEERLIKIGQFEENFLFRFLKEKSDLSVLNMQIDNLTLFYASLCLITKFWKNKWSDYSTERIRDAFLTNLMLINFKIYDYQLKEIFEQNSNDIDVIFSYRLNEQDQLKVTQLTDKYDQMVFAEDFDIDEYLDKELEEVHLINQFQAFYHSIGLLNKLAGFNLIFLSPHRFLNGKFITKYLREKTTEGTESFEIREMIESLTSVSHFSSVLMRKFDKFYQDLEMQEDEIKKEKSNDLSELLEKIKI